MKDPYRRGRGRGDVKSRPECWACGATAPTRKFLDRLGWYVGVINDHMENEVYCPGCLAAYGPPAVWAAGLPAVIKQGSRTVPRRRAGCVPFNRRQS